MAVVQRTAINFKLRIGIEDNKIGIEARSYLAFTIRDSREICRALRHPARDLFDSDMSLQCSGPNDGWGELQRRDAAPGRGEIARTALLHFGWTGRVIRCDQIDYAVLQRSPE